MNAQNDNITSLRVGIRRVFPPWEYRHLRAWAGARIGGSVVLAVLGVITLSVGSYGWAAFFLGLGALAFAGGYWQLTIARSASSRA